MLALGPSGYVAHSVQHRCQVLSGFSLLAAAYHKKGPRVLPEQGPWNTAVDDVACVGVDATTAKDLDLGEDICAHHTVPNFKWYTSGEVSLGNRIEFHARACVRSDIGFLVLQVRDEKCRRYALVKLSQLQIRRNLIGVIGVNLVKTIILEC